MNVLDEKALTLCIQEAQGGDVNAFATLYQSLSLPIYYGSLRIVKQVEEARTLTREVFLELFHCLSRLSSAQNLLFTANRLTYLYSTNYLRRKRSLTTPPANVPPQIEHGFYLPTFFASNPEKRQKVLQAVDQLSEQDRSTLLLYYVNGLSLEEIALTLGQDTHSIEKQLDAIHSTLHYLIFDRTEGDFRERSYPSPHP